VIFISKDRKKVLYGTSRKHVGAILRNSCRQHGLQLIEAHSMPDGVHICLAIPPKNSVSSVIGFPT
jgi:putative transposase